MPPSIRFNPWISKTPGRAAVCEAAALLLTMLLAGPAPLASAAEQRLSDHDLSLITAQGPEATEATDERHFPLLPVSTLQLDGANLIDAQTFAADVQALGLPPLVAPFYEGQPVLKLTLDIAPFDIRVDLSQLLGLRSPQNLSLGELQINQIDVSGTTLWVWTR